MKAQADAKRAEHIQADECHNDAGPTEEPRHKCQQCENMNRCQSDGVDPRDAKRLACLGSRQFGWHSKPAHAAGTIGSCRALDFTSDKHRHPNSVGAKAKADACQRTARRIVSRQASGHRDTPPEDVPRCRGRSPGSRLSAVVRSSQGRRASVTLTGQQLAAYSCGGSAGIDAYRRRTGFPLSFRP
jgi:hypothetical protein